MRPERPCSMVHASRTGLKDKPIKDWSRAAILDPDPNRGWLLENRRTFAKLCGDHFHLVGLADQLGLQG